MFDVRGTRMFVMRDEDIKAFRESLLADATKPTTRSECEWKTCGLSFANDTCEAAFIGGLLRSYVRLLF